jgi:hypothetical protein
MGFYKNTNNILWILIRNISRFPEDFMFQLTHEEKKEVVAICDHLLELKYSPVLPYAFTEQGIAMLSSVLNSEKAIQVNIQIMRIFIKVKEFLYTHKDLQAKIDVLEQRYNRQFKSVFDAIKLLMQNDKELNRKLSYEEEKQKNKKFGFIPR